MYMSRVPLFMTRLSSWNVPTPDGGLYTATRYEFRSIPDIRRSRHPHSLRTEETPMHWLNGWGQPQHGGKGSPACLKSLSRPGMVTHTCNLSTLEGQVPVIREAEAGELLEPRRQRL
ncbi:Semaphorin-4G [Plecturocebus cupreus]